LSMPVTLRAIPAVA